VNLIAVLVLRYAAVPTLNLLMLVRLLVSSQPASSKVTTDMTFRLPLVVLGSVSLSRPEPKPAHYEGAISDIKTGWWFGTFFIFPYIGNNHPN
jgi:hypothetical protein